MKEKWRRETLEEAEKTEPLEQVRTTFNLLWCVVSIRINNLFLSRFAQRSGRNSNHKVRKDLRR